MERRQIIFDSLIAFCILYPIYDYVCIQEPLDDQCPYDVELWSTVESIGLIISMRISVFGIDRHQRGYESKLYRFLVWVFNPILAIALLIWTIIGTVWTSRLIRDDLLEICDAGTVGWKIANLVWTYMLWSLVSFFAVVIIWAGVLQQGYLQRDEEFEDEAVEPEHLEDYEIAALPIVRQLSTVKCSIWLDDMVEGQEVMQLHCGHKFHPECVRPWLEQNLHCPNCKANIRDG